MLLYTDVQFQCLEREFIVMSSLHSLSRLFQQTMWNHNMDSLVYTNNTNNNTSHFVWVQSALALSSMALKINHNNTHNIHFKISLIVVFHFKYIAIK